VTRWAAARKTPGFLDRAARGFREEGFLLVAFFEPEDFLFAAAAGRRDAERLRGPALRALDFFRLDERVRPRAAAPRVRFLLELRRDDFLAAAMIQLRDKNVPIDKQQTIV
jgi:hypothetical protein